MNATSEDIKDMIEAESALSLEFATNLFIGVEPKEPNDTVTIFDTPGGSPALGLTSQGYEYPSIQIRARNLNYLTGWNLMESIKTLFHGRAQETWNGTLYSVIYVANGPAMLDRDDNGRFRFIINLNIQRRAV